MIWELTDAFVVPADLEQTWRFFSTATNLPLITPPWLKFSIAMPQPVAIQKDANLDYTIRWMGLPVKWRTTITEWEPPRRFVDVQTRGPYAMWHHEHAFVPCDAGGTRCIDRVLYRLPLGPLGWVTHWLLVRRQLLDIFRHRRLVIAEHLGGMTLSQGQVMIRPVRSSEA